MAFYSGDEGGFLDGDGQVFGFVGRGDGEVEVDFADGLRPFVWEGGLLGFFFGAGCGLFGGGGVWSGKVSWEVWEVMSIGRSCVGPRFGGGLWM